MLFPALLRLLHGRIGSRRSICLLFLLERRHLLLQRSKLLFRILVFGLQRVFLGRHSFQFIHDHIALQVDLIKVFDEGVGLADRRERSVLAQGSLVGLDRGGSAVGYAIRPQEFGKRRLELLQPAQLRHNLGGQVGFRRVFLGGLAGLRAFGPRRLPVGLRPLRLVLFYLGFLCFRLRAGVLNALLRRAIRQGRRGGAGSRGACAFVAIVNDKSCFENGGVWVCCRICIFVFCC